MGDFGGTLRSAREEKGISLRHIANATKISMGALEALERNDFQRLPGGIFTRSFVRAYAQEVGLDPDQAVEDFVAEAGEAFEPPAPPTEEQAPIMEERHDPALDFRQTWRPRAFSISSWAIILLVLGVPLIVFMVFRGMQRVTEAPPEFQDPMPASEVGGAPPSATAPAVPAAQTDPGPVPPLEPGQTLRLVLAPTAECWVSLTVDGEVRIASRVLNAGERETYEIRDGAVLTVGDAGAMAFTINGRPSRPLGPSGAVETLRISRTNFRDFLQ